MSQNPHQLDYANNTRRGVQALSPPERSVFRQFSAAAWILFYWAFFAFVTIGVVTVAMGMVTGTVLAGPTLIVIILLIPMCATARRMIRKRRGLAVLGYVRQAVRLNLPIHRVLLAATASEAGLTMIRLRELQEAMLSGAPISACIATTVPEVSHRALGLILVGEQTGRLGPALEHIMVGDTETFRAKADPSAVLTLWYPPLILLVVGGVISVITLYVYPRYQQILHDFRIPMPPLFSLLMAMGNWMIFLLPFVACVILLFAGLQLREAMTGKPSIAIVRRIGQRMIWYIPVAHGLVRDAGLGDVCLAIADSLESGYPLDQVLNRMPQLDVNTVLQSRIASWAGALAMGMSPADGARKSKMPALLVGLLMTASANPADVFRFAGRFYQTRSLARREILRSLYLPVWTILMGSLALLVALAIFEPMQMIVRHSGPQWTGP